MSEMAHQRPCGDVYGWVMDRVLLALTRRQPLPLNHRPALLLETHVARLRSAEQFFETIGATIHHQGNQAIYSRSLDEIHLPPHGAFTDVVSYLATKAHELVHWTGHRSRMARPAVVQYGDPTYAFEELVAQIGEAFLCIGLGITHELRADQIANLSRWHRVLAHEVRPIFAAAAAAQEAVDYLCSLSANRPARPS